MVDDESIYSLLATISGVRNKISVKTCKAYCTYVDEGMHS